MPEVQELRHVNGGVITCASCGTMLGDERAVATTPGGVKFFCRMEPDSNPEDSCYLTWRRLRH